MFFSPTDKDRGGRHMNNTYSGGKDPTKVYHFAPSDKNWHRVDGISSW